MVYICTIIAKNTQNYKFKEVIVLPKDVSIWIKLNRLF